MGSSRGRQWGELIVWPLHFLGYIKYTFAHIAAGYFVPQEFADWIMVGAVGVALLYIIRRTGHDYPVEGLTLTWAHHIMAYKRTRLQATGIGHAYSAMMRTSTAYNRSPASRG